LKKVIKIKAYIFLLAWTMMFGHGIIPHTHSLVCNTSCHKLLHKTDSNKSDHDTELKFRSHPEEVNVCHINIFLYHNYSHDNLLCELNHNTYLPALNLTGFTYGNNINFKFSGSPEKIPPLRAPPAS
jgi:hypothetical protein